MKPRAVDGWDQGKTATGEAAFRPYGAVTGQRRSDEGQQYSLKLLRRAVETAEIAFEGSGVEIRQDARLRECNYGELNGAPVGELDPRRRFIARPYPGGESYRDCVEKMRSSSGMWRASLTAGVCL